MKKLVAITLVMILALSLLTACEFSIGGQTGGNDSQSDKGGDNNKSGGNDKDGDNATGYPDYWNSEIPKMNGTATFAMQLNENNVTIFVDVKNEDVVNAYIDSTIIAGYEKKSDVRDDNHRTVALWNGTWVIVVDYGFSDELQIKLGYSPDVGAYN